MEGTKTIACVLLVLVAAASRTAGEYDGHESRMVERAGIERMRPEAVDSCVDGDCLLQNSESPVGAMWFGPRLGRRRRSEGRLNARRIIEALRTEALRRVALREARFADRRDPEVANDLVRGFLGRPDEQQAADEPRFQLRGLVRQLRMQP